MSGKLILVVGPSGSGKSVLLAHLRHQMPEVVFPISCTTRAIRPGEIEGQNYYFTTPEEFDRRVAQGDFLEWASYGGNRYGTLKQEILPAVDAGKIVVREVEVQGARQIKGILPKDKLGIIFIDAGTWQELTARITARAPIGEAELVARQKRYSDERTFMSDADIIVKNPDGGVSQAKKDFIAAVQTLAQ
jgi:guanylate kinase